jgi:hypothetical protein
MILLVVIVQGAGFYWFQLRPYQVIKHCSLSALERAKEGAHDREDHEYFCKRCKRESGIDRACKANWQ